jgi:hypothetical protein
MTGRTVTRDECDGLWAVVAVEVYQRASAGTRHRAWDVLTPERLLGGWVVTPWKRSAAPAFRWR